MKSKIQNSFLYRFYFFSQINLIAKSKINKKLNLTISFSKIRGRCLFSFKSRSVISKYKLSKQSVWYFVKLGKIPLVTSSTK